MKHLCTLLFFVGTALLYVNIIENVQCRHLMEKPHSTRHLSGIMPWVGILKYKDKRTAEVWICGVILIANKVAIGNAAEISKINPNTIRQTTRVMFPKTEKMWLHCGVHNYTLHPEFNDVTLTTIAFLHLDYQEWEYEGEMLQWSHDLSQTYSEELLAVGFTDDDFKFEQIVRRMKHVESKECKKFYAHEKLDSKWLRSARYKCFKEMYSKSPCVFDSGMALVSNSSGKWTLMGLSTWGPGCVLPNRFIMFGEYAQWLSSKIITSRRQEFQDERYMYRLEKTAENQVLLTSTSESILSDQYGECPEKRNWENVVYHEEAKYVVPHYGLGWYTFSMYDESYFDEWFCIRITAGAQIFFKTPATFWKTKGFGEKLALDQRVRDYVKVVPLESPVPPKYVTLTDAWENYNHIDIRNFFFSFQFHKVGRIKIIAYGVRKVTREVAIHLSTPPPYRTRSYKWENSTYSFRKLTSKLRSYKQTTPTTEDPWLG